MKNSPPKLDARIAAALAAHPVGDDVAAAEAWTDALLLDALDAHASDIHLDPRADEYALRFRIDGTLHDLDPLEPETGDRLIRYFKANSELHSVVKVGPEDAHFEFESDRGSVDVRVSCAPCVAGEKMTLRLLPRSRIYLGLHELGLADHDLNRSAAGATKMLKNYGLSSHEIATSLSFVICQRLVRVLCPQCKRESAPEAVDARWLSRMGIEAPEKVWSAAGCGACGGSGFSGRTGVFELWPFNETSYDLVLEGEDEHSLRQHLLESGLQPLFQDGFAKASQGITSISELRGLGVLKPS